MNRRFLETCLQPCSTHAAGSSARSQCGRNCLNQCHQNCRRNYQGRPRVLQLCLNNCNGLAAELATNRAFADRGYQVRPQLPIGRRRLLDRSVISPRTRQTFHYEDKHLDLARYLTPSGQLNTTALRQRLITIIAQIRRYQAQLPRDPRTGQQQQVRLVVRLPHAAMVATQLERRRAAALQRFLLSELAPHSIRVTVIMPGSRASQAFDA